jgi:hypothetical protein
MLVTGAFTVGLLLRNQWKMENEQWKMANGFFT